MNQKSNDEDPLDKFFNVPAVVEEDAQLPAVVEVQSELEEDFTIARTNIQEAVDHAQVAFKELSGLAKQMQAPRAYDALSKMLSSVVIANKALLEIHKNRQDVDEPIVPQVTHNHNTLIMTTAEMQARIEEAKKALAPPD
jgi:hypothetical protein